MSESDTFKSHSSIAGENSPCIELTPTAQDPRAAFLLARVSSGPRPCRWCGRTRPESPRTQPESCRLPAAFSALRAPSGPASPVGRPSCPTSKARPCCGPWLWRPAHAGHLGDGLGSRRHYFARAPATCPTPSSNPLPCFAVHRTTLEQIAAFSGDRSLASHFSRFGIVPRRAIHPA